MHRILKAELIFGLCFGLVVASSLIVSPLVGQAMTQEKQMAKAVTIDGKVKAVSDTSLTVVDAQNAEHTIAFDAKTKITKGGKAAAATDIKADDGVVVVANKGEGDALTATSITVKTPASN